MASTMTDPAADLEAATLPIATHYRSVPARETEISVALLVLWALDALDGQRVTPDVAASIMTRLWVEISNPPAGPDLSDSAHELLEEGGWLDEGAIGEAPDRDRLRAAAHVVLGTVA